MKKISAFDLAMIIAFVVVALAGAGVWYYLSGLLDTTKSNVSSAQADFDKYSSKEVYLPTTANVKTLQANIDLMQAQLDPLIKTRLQAPGNHLETVEKMDTVAWKSDLDTKVGKLNAAARLGGVTVPPNFYYGFSRYLEKNPTDEQIEVLSKQLLGVVEIANIFIGAPVRSITAFRRTYEENAAGQAPGGSAASGRGDPDELPGRSITAPGGVYIEYPYEVDFVSNTVGFRKVIDGLQASPYVFIVRNVMVENDKTTSPQISSLEALAGNNGPAVTDASPGAVGTGSGLAKSTRGPQFLFGNEILHIRVRIGLIEWKGISTGETAPEGRAPGRNNRRNGAGGGPGGGNE
jgi:hypothetical protein